MQGKIQFDEPVIEALGAMEDLTGSGSTTGAKIWPGSNFIGIFNFQTLV